MKRVLVIEDKEIHRKILIKILEETEEMIEVYEAGTVQEAYKIAMESVINLFLIDIILNTEIRGDISGLKFAQAIREIPHYAFTPMIFITSLEDPELYAYRDLHCYGYIEKPFDREMVKELIEQALRFPQEKHDNSNVYLRKDGIVYSIKTEEIISIEITRRNIVIHTVKEDVVMAYKTVKQLMNELGTDNFVQCNRGCIINKNYVEYVDSVNRYIKLRGVKEYVEIGRTMKEKVVNEFSN